MLVAAFLISAITVAPNVLVSAANPHRMHTEVRIAADPRNPRHLIACSGIEPATTFSITDSDILYESTDGGTSWALRTVQPYELDPECVILPSGSQYMIGYRGEIETGPWGGRSEPLMQSLGAGRPWSLARRLFPGDRPFLTVDAVANSPYFGSMYLDYLPSYGYVHGKSKGVLRLTVTRLQGAKVTHTTRLPFFKETLFSANGAVKSNGDYVFLSYSWPLSKKPLAYKLALFASHDGGNSFTRIDLPMRPIANYSNYNAPPWIPAMAIDGSSRFKDRISVVYVGDSGTHTAIFSAYSSDSAKTWSKPLRLNDGRGDCIHPVVTINKYGVVGVLWYDRSGVNDPVGYRARFAASTDGGRSFSPSVAVSESASGLQLSGSTALDAAVLPASEPINPKKGAITVLMGPEKRYTIQGGDTMGLVADTNGTFHALWTDNRTGVSQLWTSRITVQPVTPVATGGFQGAAPPVSDLTDSMGLLVSNATLDSRRRQITADLAVKNNTKKTIALPLTLRVVRLSSKFGHVAVLNASNKVGGVGAEFVIGSSGSLAPGATSKVFHAVFSFVPAGAYRPNPSDIVEHFVELSVKTFARARTAR